MSASTYSATNEIGDREGKPCANCGRPGHAHDKERVTPDDGPAGSWHWRYVCP